MHRTLPGVRLSGCWSHARRKYTDIIKISPSALQKNGNTPAHAGRNFCNKLFDIERDLKDATPRRTLCCTPTAKQQVPWASIVHGWTTWYLRRPGRASSKRRSDTLRNQWEDLIRFLDDGRLEIDNNRAERGDKALCHREKELAVRQYSQRGKGQRDSLQHCGKQQRKMNSIHSCALLHLFEVLPNIDLNKQSGH